MGDASGVKGDGLFQGRPQQHSRSSSVGGRGPGERRRPSPSPFYAPEGFFDLPAVVRESSPGAWQFQQQQQQEQHQQNKEGDEGGGGRSRGRSGLFLDAEGFNNINATARRVEVLAKHQRTGRVPSLGRQGGREEPVNWLPRPQVSRKLSADFDINYDILSSVSRSPSVYISPPMSGLGSDGLRVPADGSGFVGSNFSVLPMGATASRMRDLLRRRDLNRREQIRKLEVEKREKAREQRLLRKGQKMTQKEREDKVRNLGGFLDQDLPLEKISSKVRRQPVLCDMTHMLPREGPGSYFRNSATSPDWELQPQGNHHHGASAVFQPTDFIHVETPRVRNPPEFP